jgi:hypothetical protein
VCQYPETAWWRLAALTACSEQLFVLCRVPDKTNYPDAAVMPMFLARGRSAAGQGGALAA